MYLEDVEISYNTSTWEGGGVHTSNSTADFVDVRFIGNFGTSGGGGVFVGGNTTSTTFTDSLFHSNEAGGLGGLDDGGGILMNESAGDVVVTNTDFGVGPTENLPTDVYVYDTSGNHVSISYYQAGETFTCSTGTNSCQ